MSEEKPNGLDLSRLPPTFTLVLALAGLGTGATGLGLRFGDPEPPATQAEVQSLEDDVDELELAVRELTYLIRLHHGAAP